jgi:hypothetical protein
VFGVDIHGVNTDLPSAVSNSPATAAWTPATGTVPADLRAAAAVAVAVSDDPGASECR